MPCNIFFLSILPTVLPANATHLVRAGTTMRSNHLAQSKWLDCAAMASHFRLWNRSPSQRHYLCKCEFSYRLDSRQLQLLHLPKHFPHAESIYVRPTTHQSTEIALNKWMYREVKSAIESDFTAIESTNKFYSSFHFASHKHWQWVIVSYFKCSVSLRSQIWSNDWSEANAKAKRENNKTEHSP